jgi:hypothetical protein
MFLPVRPSQLAIDRFLRNSEKLPLSYAPVGIAMSGRHRGDLDEQVVAIQARFRRDSAAALQRAIHGGGVRR